jgi:hypothetical protein
LARARHELAAVGSCFAHCSLDYAANINIVHARKGFFFLDSVSIVFVFVGFFVGKKRK